MQVWKTCKSGIDNVCCHDAEMRTCQDTEKNVSWLLQVAGDHTLIELGSLHVLASEFIKRAMMLQIE